MANYLIVQFSFFMLLLAPLQILILVLSTRSAKVASRCRDLNPGSSACLAETLPLDQESLMIIGINIAGCARLRMGFVYGPSRLERSKLGDG